MDNTPIDKGVAREAAQWLMRMHPSAAPTAEDIAACAIWRSAHAEHDRAWTRAQQINARFGVLPADLSRQTLDRPKLGERRQVLKTLLALMAVTPAGWLAYRASPVQNWAADYRTATGERREIVLVDGTQVHLNTASALDVAFDVAQRFLILRAGEVLIETAPDPLATGAGGSRPFIVSTDNGIVRALGTRFLLRQFNDRSQVAVFEGAVEVRTRAAEDTLIVNAGSQLTFSAGRATQVEPANPQAIGWMRGMLHADKQRLADFVAELDRYRPGWLRCDSSVADLQISGSFQLANPEHILQALPATLPVRVEYRTRYWANVTAA